MANKAGRKRGVPMDLWSKHVWPEPMSGCWLWAGAHNAQGYGLWEAPMDWRVGEDRRGMGAHRASWYLHYGLIPDGLCVCHRCDNPACVNPEHLFLGTALDNMDDMRSKGRAGDQAGRPRRKASRMRKLTDEQVRAIRLDPRHHVAIAMAYGIGVTTAFDIKRRKTKTLVLD